MKQRHMSNLSKLCSLFCLRTNKINIKINVTCEETCSSTLQRFLIIRALKRFFLLIETWVSCTFTKCFHCFPHALLEKLFYSISEKLQDIFKRRRSFQFCWDGKLYNVDVKWTMAKEIHVAGTLSDYAKFLRLLRVFDCMKTRAMSKFCNGISQWDKRYQVWAVEKFSSEMRLFSQKVNIMWMWISLSCRLGESLLYTFSF